MTVEQDGLDPTKVQAAVRRIEESRDSHSRWVAHLTTCSWCAEHPPEHVQTLVEHEQIVAEYDGVLAVLADYDRLAALALDLQGKVAREIKTSDNLRRTYRSLLDSRDKAQAESAWRQALICAVVNYDNANQSDLPLGLLDSLREVAAEPRALADPIPAARCSQGSPLDRLTESQCSLPEGHAGGHKFTSHDGRTDLEVMPK